MSATELNKTLEKLSSISFCAQRDANFQFTSLAHHLNAEFLKDGYHHLARNKAVGVDSVSWSEYGKDLDEKLDTLVSRLKRKTYKPLPSKRVYIPKGNGELRPLGISAIKVWRCSQPNQLCWVVGRYWNTKRGTSMRETVTWTSYWALWVISLECQLLTQERTPPILQFHL